MHHGFTYTFEEGLDALPDVIRHIETYDVTTIRASTPMYLLARRIKAMGVKMVLSGEGADEIFGGYLYFHKAPDARAFHEETVRKLDALHQLRLPARQQGDDGLGRGGARAVPRPGVPRRGDGAWTPRRKMRARARRADASRRRCCARRSRAALPDAILWRQKEQFSDGVGYGWIDGLKAHADARRQRRGVRRGGGALPDQPAADQGGLPVPRACSSAMFPGDACARTVPGGKSIACSSPAAIAWDAGFAARPTLRPRDARSARRRRVHGGRRGDGGMNFRSDSRWTRRSTSCRS